MVLPLLMHSFETEATKAIDESIWPLASSCLYSGRRKKMTQGNLPVQSSPVLDISN
jgi:hypothetical protein